MSSSRSVAAPPTRGPGPPAAEVEADTGIVIVQVPGGSTPAFDPHASAEGYDLPFDVAIEDPQGDVAFRARIAMWISPRKA